MLGRKRKKEDREKVPPAEVNRKLIAWVFILSGLLSWGLWWRGKDRGDAGGANWWEGWIKPVEVSFDVESSPTSSFDKLRTTLSVRQKLLDEVAERVATASGTYAVYVYELKKGEGFGFNEREVLPGASILKLPAMITALKKVASGQWTMDSQFELLEEDRSPGSGPLQFEPAGTKVSVERMLTVMGKNSDNTAWRMINRLVGIPAIEDTILDIGMTDTDYRTYETTAVDVTKLLTKTYAGEVVGQDGWKKMENWLTDSIYEERIPAGISDKGVRIIHKVGTLEDVWSDAGIIECKSVRAGECQVEPYVLVILNKGVIRAQASALVPWVAQKVGEYEAGR